MYWSKLSLALSSAEEAYQLEKGNMTLMCQTQRPCLSVLHQDQHFWTSTGPLSPPTPKPLKCMLVSCSHLMFTSTAPECVRPCCYYGFKCFLQEKFMFSKLDTIRPNQYRIYYNCKSKSIGKVRTNKSNAETWHILYIVFHS